MNKRIVSCLRPIPLALVVACSQDSAETLDNQAINAAFENVRDQARIQDSKGSTAVNYWYSDGTFTNKWQNSESSGAVSGTWYAKNNQRCVVILQGLDRLKGKTKCGALIREHGVIKSFNADGSVHAIHTLTKIQ